MAHLEQGLQPIKITEDGKTTLYAPPIMQYRVRESIYVDGKKTLEWSEWIDVPFVKETAQATVAPEVMQL